MYVDGHSEGFGPGKHWREVDVITIPAVDGAVVLANDEVVLAHRTLELTGHGLGLTERQRSERAEPVRRDRGDLVGDPIIELAGEGEAFFLE